MRRIVPQLPTVYHALLRGKTQQQKVAQAPSSSLRPSVNLPQPELGQPRELSALRITVLATVFNLTTPDSLAFPDTALDLQRRLFGFLFEGGMSIPAKSDAS